MIRRIAAAGAVAVLIVACGPTTVTPATSPPPTASPAAASAPPAASPSPTPSAAASPMPLPQGSDPLVLDPALFAGVALDHPFWPMAPGSRWVYSDRPGGPDEGRYEHREADRVLDGRLTRTGTSASRPGAYPVAMFQGTGDDRGFSEGETVSGHRTAAPGDSGGRRDRPCAHPSRCWRLPSCRRGSS